MITRRTRMPASAEEVFAWHARPGAFARLVPPWEDVRLIRTEGTFGDGYRVTLRAGLFGPIGAEWVAEHFDTEPGRRFRDRQVKGPFAEWVHTHEFIPDGPDASILEDRVEFKLPLGPFGAAAEGDWVHDKIERMFAYRHAVTASDLSRHGRYRDRPRLTVAVTGSRGLVGSDLCPFLTAAGHRVLRLVRGPVRSSTTDDGTTDVGWNPDGELDPKCLEGVDAVVHLAGEGIADGRWTAAKKARIRESRIGPTRRLAEAAARAGVKALISASAIGIYGDRGDEGLDESAPAGTGFLANLAREWEAAADPARAAGVRVVHPRIGIVLSPRGGALAKQLPAFRAGGGAVLGSGKQWLSWVTIHDLIGMLHFALMEEHLSGPVNAVAPGPVTNREFGRVLAGVLGRPFLLTVPAAGLRLLFGELADAALLASQHVIPRRLLDSSFAFGQPELAGALRFLLGR